MNSSRCSSSLALHPAGKHCPPRRPSTISNPRLCERCRERTAVAADPSPSAIPSSMQAMEPGLPSSDYNPPVYGPDARRCAWHAPCLPRQRLAGNTCLRLYGRVAGSSGRPGKPLASGPIQGDHSPSSLQHAMSQVAPGPQITSIPPSVALFAYAHDMMRPYASRRHAGHHVLV